jgi:hypothetical protein
VALSWDGPTSGIYVVRDGVTIATDVNGSSCDDRKVNRGGGATFTYKVCTSPSNCSDEVPVSFQ